MLLDSVDKPDDGSPRWIRAMTDYGTWVARHVFIRSSPFDSARYAGRPREPRRTTIQDDMDSANNIPDGSATCLSCCSEHFSPSPSWPDGFFYQHDREIIAFARPDLAASGTGLSLVAQVGRYPHMESLVDYIIGTHEFSFWKRQTPLEGLSRLLKIG